MRWNGHGRGKGPRILMTNGGGLIMSHQRIVALKTLSICVPDERASSWRTAGSDRRTFVVFVNLFRVVLFALVCVFANALSCAWLHRSLATHDRAEYDIVPDMRTDICRHHVDEWVVSMMLRCRCCHSFLGSLSTEDWLVGHDWGSRSLARCMCSALHEVMSQTQLFDSSTLASWLFTL